MNYKNTFLNKIFSKGQAKPVAKNPPQTEPKPTVKNHSKAKPTGQSQAKIKGKSQAKPTGKKQAKKTKVLMAVSPSGGHIYPALAIIEKLKSSSNSTTPTKPIPPTQPVPLTKPIPPTVMPVVAGIQKKPSWEFSIIYNHTPLSQKILQDCSYPCYPVSLGGLATGQAFVNKIKTLLQLPIVFFKSLKILYKTKADIIFGTGGSVTVPVLMAGFVMRKKLAIWEANTSLGLANKFLTPFVSCVFTVFPKVTGLKSKKQKVSAYPLRKKIQSSQQSQPLQQSQTGDKIQSSQPLKQSQTGQKIQTQYSQQSSSHQKLQEEDFPEDLFKILILGGSQGSVFLNQVIAQTVQQEDWRKDLFIYHQTGEKHFKEVQKKYQSLKQVKALSFINNIQDYYQNCDLIFSRAGSGAISEIAIFKKPLVLIPLTYSAGGHQKQNALSLFKNQSAELIEEKNFNPKSFKNKILNLKKDKPKRIQLAKNLKKTFQQKDHISAFFIPPAPPSS